jgi:hypothetical protein
MVFFALTQKDCTAMGFWLLGEGSLGEQERQPIVAAFTQAGLSLEQAGKDGYTVARDGKLVGSFNVTGQYMTADGCNPHGVTVVAAAPDGTKHNLFSQNIETGDIFANNILDFLQSFEQA